MYLENIVFDATDPQELGRSWETRLGTETLTDEPEGYETRLAVPDGPVLDLCFQRVAEPPTGPERLHLDYDEQAGALAALRLEVADAARDQAFWAWLTGWVPVAGGLQHPSGKGLLLELSPESEPKTAGKNRVHLDLRLEAGDDVDALAQEIADRGGREYHPGWGDLPWRFFQDPSGNEFCLLPAPSVTS